MIVVDGDQINDHENNINSVIGYYYYHEYGIYFKVEVCSQNEDHKIYKPCDLELDSLFNTYSELIYNSRLIFNSPKFEKWAHDNEDEEDVIFYMVDSLNSEHHPSEIPRFTLSEPNEDNVKLLDESQYKRFLRVIPILSMLFYDKMRSIPQFEPMINSRLQDVNCYAIIYDKFYRFPRYISENDKKYNVIICV